MRIVLVFLLTQMLLFTSGGCATQSVTAVTESPSATIPASSSSDSWDDKESLLNELKDIVLSQEGRYNLCRRFDGEISKDVGCGTITLEPREDIQIALDMNRVTKLMDELELYIVYVRPEEEYFGFRTPVELTTPWPYNSQELCYSSSVAPECSWDSSREWEDLGGGWYTMYIEQV